MVEHHLDTVGVGGSIPPVPTMRLAGNGTQVIEVNPSDIPVGRPLWEYIKAKDLKQIIAAKLDDKIIDVHTPVKTAPTTAVFLTAEDKDSLFVLRHSAAHVMAEAVKKLFPTAQVTIGPATETGFYYDYDYEPGFTVEDLEKIEAKMREIAATRAPFRRTVVSREEMKKLFADMGEHFKVEIIDGIPGSDELSYYKQGEFLDLCRGPHLPHTGFMKGIKLTHTAGAYWRGDENNKMLRRIYGVAYFSEAELKKHLEQQEEAKKRDHRKLGRELELFGFHPFAPASPFFLPKGTIVYNAMVEFMRSVYRQRGYQEVITPQIFDADLFKKSGHYDNYRDNMYFASTHDSTEKDEADAREFSAKPMNCPSHCLIFGMHKHSYRGLPYRMADFGRLHRYERSGVTAGLTRVRTFCQDDAHIFCTVAQMRDEMLAFIDLVGEIYPAFGITEWDVKLATRPEKSIGSDEAWNLAENSLAQAMNERGIKFEILKGEGAFYGPKIEFHIKDAIGRSWQLGTLQVDFAMPERFELSYVDSDNSEKRPLMLHRAIFGSLERFFGVYLEHTSGNFPGFLAPEQVRIIAVSNDQNGYAQEVLEKLLNQGIRAGLDISNEKLGAKIRDAQLMKVPYAAVVGKKEVSERLLAIRKRGGEDLGAKPLEEAIAFIVKESAPPALKSVVKAGS